MPWQHCEQTIHDNVPCPKCGVDKKAWTTEWNVTRTFAIKPKREKPVFKLTCHNHLGRPLPEEPFRVTHPDGVMVEGETSKWGYGKVDLPSIAMVEVAFPKRAEVDFVTNGGEAPASFTCDPEQKALFRLVARLTDPQWERPEALVGDYVLARAKTRNLPEGSAVVVVVRHKGRPAQVDRLTGPVRDSAVEIPWRSVFKDPLPPELAGKAYRERWEQPEYEFDVSAECALQATSGPLKLKDFIELLLEEPSDELEYRMVLPDGAERRGPFDARGWAREEDLPPGRCEVELVKANGSAGGPRS